jgi:hypothetical protein
MGEMTQGRRMAVLMACGCALMGMGTALTIRWHLWAGFVFLGVQVVMLAAAMGLLARESGK